MSSHGSPPPPSHQHPPLSTVTRSPSPLASESESDLDIDLQELEPSPISTYLPVADSGYRVIGRDSTVSPAGRLSAFTQKAKDSSPGIALKLLMGAGRRKYERLKSTDDSESSDTGGVLDATHPSSSSGKARESSKMLWRKAQFTQERSPSSALLNPAQGGSSRSSSKSSIRQDSTFPPPPPSPFPVTTAKNNTSVDSVRIIPLTPGSIENSRYPLNIISNHRFTPFTFLPLTLYHEFSYFFNLYFLLVAVSQFIPVLRIGFISSYVVPLVFVLCVTLGKEALDDLARRRRDAEANSEPYEVIGPGPLAREHSIKNKKAQKKPRARDDDSRVIAEELMEEEQQLQGQGDIRTITKKAKDIKVGDILVLCKDQRVPADVIILKSIPTDPTDEPAGEAFIRTDQLDGETDWKLRVAPSLTQSLPTTSSALSNLTITASAPSKDVNTFLGKIELNPGNPNYPTGSQALSIDNTAWANTVLASTTTTIAAVMFTGPETRQSLSTSKARSKTGLLEEEINNLTKILCLITFTLSIALVGLQGVEPRAPSGPGQTRTDDDMTNIAWYVKIVRFLILFSSIIPISLRVNLDMGKSVYARFIERDEGIKGTVVRTSTIPEDLGRVEYLLSDKTGTLTQNGTPPSCIFPYGEKIVKMEYGRLLKGKKRTMKKLRHKNLTII